MRVTLAKSHAVRTIEAIADAPQRAADWPRKREPRQGLRDKLCVAALLVLATVTVFALYVAHQQPYWRTGQIGGFESNAPPANQEKAATAAVVAVAPGRTPTGERAINRLSLALWSMLIEMAIFCGLGLYLRHETNRKP